MSFTLDQVVPWGRSFDEYVSMFSLTENDLSKNILGCGDGPASFNTELTQRGGSVISIDPIYHYSAEDIRNRLASTYEEIMDQTRANQHEFVWDTFKSIDDLGRMRMEAMENFLDDYQENHRRYIEAELPVLPFKDASFDLALSSHFLFLYSEQLSYEFHIQSVKELCRVANEARVFPILELGSRKSRHIVRVVNELASQNYSCNIEKVDYEFQRGGNEMLRILPPNI